MTDDHEPRPAPVSASSEDTAPHDAIGAYLLDALPAAQRAAFEAHLGACEACRQEAAQLAPVVHLLPQLLELDPEPWAPISADSEPEALVPSPELRERLLTMIRDEAGAAVPSEPVTVTEEAGAPAPPAIETAPPSVSLPPARPRGRIRGGVMTAPGAVPATPWATMSRLPRGWLAAVVLAVVAVGAIIWALALQGRIGDHQREIAALRTENMQLRQRANATAWQLVPTADGQANAIGTLFFSLPQQTGILYVRNMATLPEGRVYQLWYLRRGEPSPVPGPTLTVDGGGTGFAIVAADVPTYDAIILTEEPEGGSQAPTSAILLQAALGGAAGAVPGELTTAAAREPTGGSRAL